MQVSLQALKTFEAAARLGSFKVAAEELAITPTAVSHHISNLESRLNVALFYRHVRKVQLTEAGEKLSSATSDGFRKIEAALEEVQFSGKAVRVTTTSSLAALVLIPSLGDFSNSYPEINIEVLTGEALENQPFNLPVRLGDVSRTTPADIIKKETFNMFGAYRYTVEANPTDCLTVYTIEWKNKALPEPPLEAWFEVNGWDQSKVNVMRYDQELFGIQEALASKGLVFCSTTLTRQLVESQLLQAVGVQPIDSELCYYVPNRERYSDRKTSEFLSWLTHLLSK